MPWRIFKSLSWLVNMKSGDDLCIAGLCPSVRAAVLLPPPPPVSKAQRGGRKLTFFSGRRPRSQPDTICEFLFGFCEPSSNEFLQAAVQAPNRALPPTPPVSSFLDF
jgi:hypothetical protein